MKWSLVLVCVVLLVTSCTTAEKSDPPAAVTSADTSTTPVSEPTVTPSPAATVEPTQSCDGLGTAPRRGEVTFVQDGKLLAVSPDSEQQRCLVDMPSRLVSTATAWNGPADRILLGDSALSGDLSVTSSLTGGVTDSPLWSRPNGTSVVYVTKEGRLMKRSSFGGRAFDISFLSRHDDVAYHPAGQHIVSSGLAEDGSYGLYMATNLGDEAELLARGEEASLITDLNFSHTGRTLYFSAKHGAKEWHLHQIEMGADARLETLEEASFGFRLAVSEVEEVGPVSWSTLGDCAAGEPDRLYVAPGEGIDIPDALKKTSLQPVGWLPGRRLVVTSHPVSCNKETPRDVFVLDRGAPPVVIAQDIGTVVAVRAALPPPPPPPGQEQQVLA